MLLPNDEPGDENVGAGLHRGASADVGQSRRDGPVDVVDFQKAYAAGVALAADMMAV